MKIRELLRKDILIFTIGIALVCYPIVSNYVESIQRDKLISTYDSEADNLSSKQKETMLEEARLWNNDLYLKQKGMSTDNNLDYQSVLNLGNGVIGTIEIPQIKLNIPIYHGTNDSELNAGAGHVEDSSLPVGGVNTHTVLTGHSGLPSSKLFTRLDELKKGELFYIKVLDETIAYKIDKIEVVLPEDAKYDIEDGKDLATLVTCTPYGVNTHRLMVTGHRVPFVPEQKNEAATKIPSLHEIAVYSVPVIFTVLGIIVFKKKKGAKINA